MYDLMIDYNKKKKKERDVNMTYRMPGKPSTFNNTKTFLSIFTSSLQAKHFKCSVKRLLAILLKFSFLAFAR